jgi:hypothetical protein
MTNGLSISQKLEAKLKKTDPDIQQYIIAIHKKKRKLEIQNMRLIEMVDTLQSKIKEHYKTKYSFDKLSKEEIVQLSDLLKKAIK